MATPEKFKIKKHIWIEYDMYYSKAFRCLSKSAMLTLMRCLQKRKWETVKVRGRKKFVYTDDGFIFPYAEALALGIASSTQFWKNMCILIGVGFLDVLHQGGWYQKHEKEKDCSVYRYSERWRKYGTPEFVAVDKPRVLPKHFHVRENIEKQKLESTSRMRSEQLHKSEGDRADSEIPRLHESEVDETATESPQPLAAIV